MKSNIIVILYAFCALAVLLLSCAKIPDQITRTPWLENQTNGGTPPPPPGAPNAPTALVATAVAHNQINLSWTDNSTDETGFRVFQNTINTKPGTALATNAADIVIFSDTGLNPNTPYYYWVEAFNAHGASSDISGNDTTPPGPPAFAAPVMNAFGLFNVGNGANPALVDIDNDGDLDVFIGVWNGDTMYFENTGSASAPAFAAPVTNAFGLTDVGMHASPTFVDINNDGDLDAFIGDDTGNTMYFTNIGTAAAPAFETMATNPFGLENVGTNAAPTFADIDGDGDLDAFIGIAIGNTMYFTNTGSASVPAFASVFTNPFGLANVGSDASPTFVDIDNDGDLDAFIGNYDGNTIYFTNTGTVTTPAFGTAVINPFGLTDVGHSSSPAFVDIDNDGDFDAFIGNYDGNTLYFQNTSI